MYAQNNKPGLLHSVGNTPVVKLKKIVSPDDADVYVKIEYLNPTGSYKDRMALAIIDQAEKRGDLSSGMTVTECTAGSTGTSLAFICALKGYPFKVVTSDAFAPEKLRAIQVFGAELEIVPSTEGKITPDLIPRMLKRVEEISQSPEYYWTRQFENVDAFAGYHALGAEMINQIDTSIDAFCAAVGTAGMFIGVVQEFTRQKKECLYVALEPESAPLISKGIKGSHKIDGIGVGFIPPLLQFADYDEVLLVNETDARDMAKRLAKEEGILAGTSTGLNVCGALQLAKRFGKGHTVATVACDSGLKYMNTGLFD